MSRDFFGIEKGLDFYNENGDLPVVRQLFGSAVPGGDAGDQDAAPVPSLYFRTGTPEVYRKIANAGATSDWQQIGGVTAPDQTFREECIRVATSDSSVAAGTRDLAASPFLDDDAPLITGADFVVGDFIISGIGSTPALFEVTAIAGDVLTLVAASSPLAAGNNFVAKNYLPDSPNTQEVQALVHYNGSSIVKLGDVNWELATGISLSGSYVEQNGNVAPGDSVELALSKLDGNQRDLQSLSGVAQGDVDLGTFTGNTISDNSTIKDALQEIETALENIDTNIVASGTVAQNTPTVVDTVNVDTIQATEWEITAHDLGTPGNVQILKLEAIHNGHAGADADTVKDVAFAKMKIGNFNLQVAAVLNGVGAAQTMGLEIDTSDADGIRYSIRRTDIPALV